MSLVYYRKPRSSTVPLKHPTTTAAITATSQAIRRVYVHLEVDIYLKTFTVYAYMGMARMRRIIFVAATVFVVVTAPTSSFRRGMARSSFLRFLEPVWQ